MKKLPCWLRASSLFVLYAAAGGSPLLAADYTWVGSSGNWDTTASWSPAGTPGSTDSIATFGASAASLSIVSDRAIVNLSKLTGSVANATVFNATAGTKTLTLSGSLTVQSGVLAMRSNSATALLDLEVQGAVTVAGGNLRLGSPVTGASNSTSRLDSLKVLGKTSISSGNILSIFTSPTNTNQMAEVANNGLFIVYRGPAASAAGALSVAGLSGSGTSEVSDENNAISAVLTINGANAFSYSGVLQNGTGDTLSLTKSNSGTQTLTGSLNSYTGATTINGGVLEVGTLANGGANSSIGASTNAASNLVLSGGTLRYTGASVAIDRNYTLAASTMSSIDVASANLTISGNSANTSGGLTKIGSGTLTLTGANLHNGNTVVSAGTLVLTGGGSIGNSNAIRIASGATMDTGAVTLGFKLQSGQRLENKGTFSGGMTALAGSTYANSGSPGIANQKGDLALNTTSSFEWGLTGNTSSGAGTSFSQTSFTSGGLTIQTGVTANLIFNAESTVDWTNSFWASSQQWLLFTGATSLSTVSDVFTNLNIGVDSTGASLASVRSGASFSFTTSGNDVYLNYTIVPEPSTLVLLSGALTVFTIIRRRRAFVSPQK